MAKTNYKLWEAEYYLLLNGIEQELSLRSDIAESSLKHEANPEIQGILRGEISICNVMQDWLNTYDKVRKVQRNAVPTLEEYFKDMEKDFSHTLITSMDERIKVVKDKK